MHAEKLLVVRCLSGSTRCMGEWSWTSARNRLPVKIGIRRSTDPTPMTKTHRRLCNMRVSMTKQPLGCQVVYWNLVDRLPLNPETTFNPANPDEVMESIVSHQAACDRPVQCETVSSACDGFIHAHASCDGTSPRTLRRHSSRPWSGSWTTSSCKSFCWLSANQVLI
jgi:hypothetical protein